MSHSRSRTEIDHNYQGGLRSRQQKRTSLPVKIFRLLRFIVLWGGLIALGTLYYQERLWNNAYDNQAEGHFHLITKLVKDSTNLNKQQKLQLIDAISNQRLKRCYFIRPFISIKCASSMTSR